MLHLTPPRFPSLGVAEGAALRRVSATPTVAQSPPKAHASTALFGLEEQQQRVRQEPRKVRAGANPLNELPPCNRPTPISIRLSQHRIRELLLKLRSRLGRRRAEGQGSDSSEQRPEGAG